MQKRGGCTLLATILPLFDPWGGPKWPYPPLFGHFRAHFGPFLALPGGGRPPWGGVRPGGGKNGGPGRPPGDPILGGSGFSDDFECQWAGC